VPSRIVLVLLFLPAACGRAPAGEVVVYTSFDSIFAREIFDAFTRRTGIAVKSVPDTEEGKTIGLVNRLLQERAHPQADVFWNGECARTVFLGERGILEPYRPPTAGSVGAEWRDPGDRWVGFGARARVIVYTTDRVKKPPSTLAELADPAWRERVVMANPFFGTTATHVAALAQQSSEEAVLKLLESFRANGIRLVGGNSHVRDLVARGERDVGLTDTDDVWVGKQRGDPIDMVYPDQDGTGTLLIPNTVALVKGAPRPVQAKAFIDFLAGPEAEALLAGSRSRQMPVRLEVAGAAGVPTVRQLKAMKVDWPRVTASEDFLIKARRSLGL